MTFDEWWEAWPGPATYDAKEMALACWTAGRNDYKKAVYKTMYSANTADLGVERVREFHVAFGAHIEDAPRLPDLSEADRDMLAGVAHGLHRTARLLKQAAAESNGLGRTGLGLLLVRLNLHIEENAELADGFANGDLVEVLDALTDISYVVDGTYLSVGMASVKVAADEEVHRSNMTKLGADGRPIISDAGRVIKGPHYERPRLEPILARAIVAAHAEDEP